MMLLFSVLSQFAWIAVAGSRPRLAAVGAAGPTMVMRSAKIRERRRGEGAAYPSFPMSFRTWADSHPVV